MENDIYDLLILGGGCAGLTAGIYAGRAKLKAAVVEKQGAGGQAAITDEIANYPGFKKISGTELAERMLEQATSFGTEFIQQDVVNLKLTQEIKEVETSSGVLRSRAVILATGAEPKKLGFPGEEEFRGRGIGYCATCDGFFFEGKDIFVIGGGYSAAEEALYLTRFGKKVTVVVRKGAFKCAKSISDKVLSHPKIEVMFHTEIAEAYGDTVLRGAVFKNNQTGESFEYKAAKEDETFGIFVFIGYQPSTELYQGQVALDEAGHVLTNERMETNLSGVYAAGDLRPKLLRQLVTATSDGAIAATQVEKYITEYKERHGIREEKSRDVSEQKEADSVDEPAIISQELRSQVQTVFDKLERETYLAVILDDSKKSEELRKFCEEVCSIGNKIHMEILRKGEDKELEAEVNAENFPMIALLKETKEYSGVKFAGIPAGHEFNSFVLAVYNLSGPGQGVEESVQNRVMAVQRKVKLQIAISLSCHFCPETVIAAQHLAVLNPQIEAEMIDISMFPQLKNTYSLMSVPALIIDEKQTVFGALSMEQILEQIEKEG